MEDFVYRGHWYYPGEIENKVLGTLTYDVSHNIRLVLDHPLRVKTGVGFEIDIEIILGDLTNGDEITLLNNFPVKSDMFDHSLKIASSNIILKGVHFNSKADMLFNKMSATYNTLDAFLHSSGALNKADFLSYIKTGVIDFQYTKPDPIVIELSDTLIADIVSFPDWKYNSKKFHLDEYTTFSLQTKESSLTIDDIFEYSGCFQLFLSMATTQTTYTTSLKLQTVDFYEIDIFFNTPHAGIVVEFDECYFKYPLIKDEFKLIIKTWFINYKQMKPVIELFLSHSYSTDKRFTPMYFVNIANALESFHIRALEDMTKTRPVLRTRLKELVDKYKTDTFSLYVTDVDDFILKTKDSRNYYTHYDPKAEAGALKLGALHAHYERMKILLLTALLVQSGMSIDLVEKIHKENRSIRV